MVLLVVVGDFLKFLFVLTVPALMASISDQVENQNDNDDSCTLPGNYDDL